MNTKPKKAAPISRGGFSMVAFINY